MIKKILFVALGAAIVVIAFILFGCSEQSTAPVLDDVNVSASMGDGDDISGADGDGDDISGVSGDGQERDHSDFEQE